MFGKIFESLYEGSMVGAGAMVFAVWSYVIAKQKPHREHGSVVRLHPITMASALGEQVEDVEKAIEYLCSPDPKSQNPECEGRRLVPLSPFDYKVVSGRYYRKIRNQEERAEYQAMKQAEYRMRRKVAKAFKRPPKMKGEAAASMAVESGASPQQVQEIISDSLPESCRPESNGEPVI